MLDALEAKRVIRKHYGLARPVTDKELMAEVAMLKRRGPDDLDDRQEALYIALRMFDAD